MACAPHRQPAPPDLFPRIDTRIPQFPLHRSTHAPEKRLRQLFELQALERTAEARAFYPKAIFHKQLLGKRSFQPLCLGKQSCLISSVDFTFNKLMTFQQFRDDHRSEPERDHLHILAFGHPPEARYRQPEGITPRLQRVLDAMPFSPAIIRTATWDVVAWNVAATLVLTDYAKLPKDRRNILRMMFSDERVRAAQDDWRSVARYVVAAFRADAMRAGAGAEIQRLVDELSASSFEFKALWDDNEIAGFQEGIKRLHHPDVGPIELEFSTFAVEGRADLNMMVYSPANSDVMEQFRSLISRTCR